MGAREGEIAVTDAPPDPDRGDPQPRPFDPPRYDVGQRRPQVTEAEPRVEVVIDVDMGAVRPNAEQDT